MATDFFLNLEDYDIFFSVPSDVVDKCINDANLGELKFILYLFRNKNKKISLENILYDLKTTKEQLKEAIEFWNQKGLLINKGTNFALANKVSVNKNKIKEYSQEEIISEKNNNKAFENMLYAYESIVARPITKSEINFALYAANDLSFEYEAFIILVNYCKSKSKDTLAYIKSVAVAWSKKGINTVEKAEEYIKNNEQLLRFENIVKIIVGINGRNLTESEKKFIDSWFTKYNCPAEFVKIAFNKTVDKIGKISFPYMNKLIMSWCEKGYKSVSDIEKENKNYIAKNKKDPIEIKSIDEILERMEGKK